MNVTLTYYDANGDHKEISLRGCREEDWQGLLLAILTSGVKKVEVQVQGF